MGRRRGRLFSRPEDEQVPATLSVVVPAVVDEPGEMDGESPLYLLLDGIPVTVRTLTALDRVPCVAEIVVVIRERELQRMAGLCREFGIGKVSKVICCASPGLEAVRLGAYECRREAEYIAVHDPLCPFVSAPLVERVLSGAKKSGAAAPALPVKDTIKTVRDGAVGETLDRNTLYTVQSPRIVQSSLLKGALEKAADSAAGGDGPPGDLLSALEGLGLPLTLVAGDEENRILRGPADIAAAEVTMNWRPDW